VGLTEKVQKLRQQTREQVRQIARLKEKNEFLAEASKNLRMRSIDIKTDGGTLKGKIAFYCDELDVTRQGACVPVPFFDYLIKL